MLHLLGLATGFLMVQLPEPANECGPARYLSAGYGCAGPVDTKNCINDICDGKGQNSFKPGWSGSNGGSQLGISGYTIDENSVTGDGSTGNGDMGNGNTGNGNTGNGNTGNGNMGFLPGGGSGNVPGFIIPGIFPPVPLMGNTPPNSGNQRFKIPPYNPLVPPVPRPVVPLVPGIPVPATKVVAVTTNVIQPPMLFTKTILVRSTVTTRVPQLTTLFVDHPPVTIKEPPVTTTYTMPPEVVVETKPPVVVALPPSTVTCTAQGKTVVETLQPDTVTEPAVTVTMTERYTMPPVRTQVYPPVTLTKTYPPMTLTKTYPPVTLSSPPSTLYVVSTSVPPPRVLTRSTVIYVTSTINNRPVTITYFVERPFSRFSTMYKNKPNNVNIPGKPGNGFSNRPGIPGNGFPGIPGNGIPGNNVPGGNTPGGFGNVPGIPGSGVPGNGNNGFGNIRGFTTGNLVSNTGNVPGVITIPSGGGSGINTYCDTTISPCVENLLTGAYTPPSTDNSACSYSNISACTSALPETTAPIRKRSKRRSSDSSEGKAKKKKNKAESNQDSESSQEENRKSKKSNGNNATVKNDTKKTPNSKKKRRDSNLKSELNSGTDNPSQGSSPNWLINKIASLVSGTPKKSSLVDEGTAKDDDKMEVLYLSDLVGNQS